MKPTIRSRAFALRQEAEDQLRAAFEEKVSIPETEWQFLRSRIRGLSLRRHASLLRQEEVCDRVYFVVHGLLRIFQVREGREVNLGFEFENRFFTAYDSLLTNSPARYGAATLEPTELLCFDASELQNLYDRHSCWERFGRLQAEEAFLTKARKEVEYRCWTPLERYRSFAVRRPFLLNRIPQYHLASYVGVTPETLSRLLSRQTINDNIS